MLLTLKGIVLRETNAGDKGRFIDILTEEMGVAEVYVRGAVKVTGKSTGITQLFSYAEFNVEQKGDMRFFQGGKSIRIFYGLRNDLLKLSLAYYFAELIRFSVSMNMESKEILRLVLNTLHFLEEGSRSPDMLKPLFELRLVSELGYIPDLLMCRSCMDHLPEKIIFSVEDGRFWCRDCYDELELVHNTAIFRMDKSCLSLIRFIMLVDMERLYNFRVNDATLKTVSAFAEEYARYHLDIYARSLGFWRSVRYNGYR